MSRTDVHDFEYPPGLNAMRPRSNNDRDASQHTYYTNTMFSTGDRRPSQGISGYPGYSVTGSRPLGVAEREYGFGTEVNVTSSVPNRHNASLSAIAPIPTTSQSFSSLNHHHRRFSPPPSVPSSYHSSPPISDRDAHIFRTVPSPATNPVPPNSFNHRTTLWWGEIEPWMDEEYVKQVCALMGWDPVNIKVPHPAPDPVNGQQANNPGFCYLTFSTAAQAASVLAQINGGGNAPVTMPNSSKPFVLNWASAVQTASPSAFSQGANASSSAMQQQQFPKEYSIFVGDLAPETSNSDLVAVFRNPVLGLRNDREPKFIRPFASCKSAKIMLDPVTGVSRGYGFVRFTDESDQQRALIEMHGLYCLSRPMRISPATAKYKAPPGGQSLDLPQVQFPPQLTSGYDQQPQPVTIALPLPNSNLTKSVSNPIAATASHVSPSPTSITVPSSGSGLSLGGSNSTASLSSGSTTSLSTSGFGSMTSEEMMSLPNSVLAQIAAQYASGEANPPKQNGTSITQTFVQDGPIRQHFGQGEGGAPRYTISEESWKHHAQARAILGNLIGPNGEQLTSTDPYNTTVFVGGLSPLIQEDTLRTFFAPFGDIHYVKVPVGKHCGFVQFVRKADAERAIEKMQGFPVGGSRIRLSWGRSQYKAAQAAAQAAQAAAVQAQFPNPVQPTPNMTQEQAIQLLQKFNLRGYIDNVPHILSDHTSGYTTLPEGVFDPKIQESVMGVRNDGSHLFESFSSNGFQPRPEIQRAQSSFAPFSPDANTFVPDTRRRESFSRSEMLPHPSKAYAPGFFPQQPQELMVNTDVAAPGKHSPTSARPSSATRYNTFLESSNSFGINRAPGRPEVTISRPPSGQTGPASSDSIHDLSGGFTNLDLDRPINGTPGTVTFRVTDERTPSPPTRLLD